MIPKTKLEVALYEFGNFILKNHANAMHGKQLDKITTEKDQVFGELHRVYWDEANLFAEDPNIVMLAKQYASVTEMKITESDVNVFYDLIWEKPSAPEKTILLEVFNYWRKYFFGK